MGAVIKKEFWTVEQIFRFVDERLDKHAFYAWETEEGASKREVIEHWLMPRRFGILRRKS